MKYLFIIVMLVGLLSTIKAQDIIIRKDGSEIPAKVLEVNLDQVKYVRFDNQNGPVYSEYKSKILKIKYSNGIEDVFVKEDTTMLTSAPQAEQHVPKEKKARYSGLVEILPYAGLANWGLDYDLNDFNVGGVCIGTTHGILLADKVFLGAGVGINLETDHILVPVYANLRIDLSRSKVRPFLSFSLGAQFGSYEDNHDDTFLMRGVWSNALVGCKFKDRWYVGGGLTVQTASYESDHWYDGSGRYISGSSTQDVYGTLGIIACVGVCF